jgi:superfamily II DNA or RNA helicase
MAVLATGLGKTVIFSNLPSRLPQLGKMLVLAHRNELLTQAVDKIRLWNPTLKVGLEKAEFHADPDCNVVVACNASVGRKGSTRLDSFWNDIGIIVVDECHHILGGSYLQILEDSGVLLPDSKKLLVGFTATPKRKNKARTSKQTMLDEGELLQLKSVFSKIVYSFPIRKGIKEGFLAPLHGFRISTKTNLDDVKTVGGDFQQDELSTAVNTNERNMQVVKAYKDNADWRQTLCFTVDVQHAEDLAECFNANGIKAAAVWGATLTKEERIAAETEKWGNELTREERNKEKEKGTYLEDRGQKLEDYEAGKTQVLCNCALLTEGFDSPSTSCIILARPTKSGTLYTQMVGRGTRLHPGKENCTVIDVCDNAKRNTLVTLPTLVGLSPDVDLKGEDMVKAAEKMEELQSKYPSVDLSHLTDLSKVKAYVESLDLFSEPFTAEVTEFSRLKWMATAEDTYVLQIPEKRELQGQFARYLHEKLTIETNELDEYVLSITTTQTDKQLGVYSTLKEAFESADDVVVRCRSDRMALLTRTAEWHSRPASEPAKKMLRKLGKGNPVLMAKIDAGITAGECSNAINTLQARKG